MNCHYRLIAAISALSEKNAFDYIIAIGPILLSVIAIVISICTTRKQNKIALFEKRCCVLDTIRRIIFLSKIVVTLEESYISTEEQRGQQFAISQKSYQMCESYNSTFGTKLNYKDKNSGILSMLESKYNVERELMQAKYLFCPEIDTLLLEMSKTMVGYMIDIISQKDTGLSKKEFCEKGSEFETEWLPKLEEKTRITRGLHFKRG